MKQKVAAAAARLLTEAGTVDYGWARRKAARSLGVSRERDLPDMMMIESTFRDYQAMFRPQDVACVEGQRKAAMQMMAWLAPYAPHLAGPLARGISAPHADILIYVYADSTKEFVFTLMDKKLSFESDDVMLDEDISAQLFFIAYAEHQFRLLLMPSACLRQPPLDEVSGQRDGGLTLEQLEGVC